jgi:hypothetical protein
MISSFKFFKFLNQSPNRESKSGITKNGIHSIANAAPAISTSSK